MVERARFINTLSPPIDCRMLIAECGLKESVSQNQHPADPSNPRSSAAQTLAADEGVGVGWDQCF